MGFGWSNSGRGGGTQNSLYFQYERKKQNKTREWVPWNYLKDTLVSMYLKDTLVISICKIYASEMLYLRTAGFQCPAMLLQFLKQKFGWSDKVYEVDWFKVFSIKKRSIVRLNTFGKIIDYYYHYYILFSVTRYFEESVSNLKFAKLCFKNKPEAEILKKI